MIDEHTERIRTHTHDERSSSEEDMVMARGVPDLELEDRVVEDDRLGRVLGCSIASWAIDRSYKHVRVRAPEWCPSTNTPLPSIDYCGNRHRAHRVPPDAGGATLVSEKTPIKKRLINEVLPTPSAPIERTRTLMRV